MALVYKKLAAKVAARQITAILDHYLSEASILLSLSGGSAIETEMIILRSLSNTANLTVTLNDERFGPPGHLDSNWQQLKLAGLKTHVINFYEPLQGKDKAATLFDFNKFLASSLNSFDKHISILGMGADGHTSGVLPASPATSSHDLACFYHGPDYQRLTNTFNFLSRQDELFVLAYGAAKHAQIERLASDIDPKEQPIQIIKQVDNVTFYNDYKGEAE